MFDRIESLLPLVLPTALFGRRRGGDRHGEVAGDGAGPTGPAGAEVDAFAAFAQLAEVPGPHDAGTAIAEGGEAVPAPPAYTGTDVAPPVDAPVDLAALDLVNLDLTDLDLNEFFGSLAPEGDPSLGDPPPGWVVGETSLDGPHVSHEQDRFDDQVDRVAELWHAVPPPAPFVDAPPFEDRVPDLDVSGGVWTPAAIEPIVGPRLDEPAPAPFALNRLRRVAGPVDDDHPHEEVDGTEPVPAAEVAATEYPVIGPIGDPFETIEPRPPAARADDTAGSRAGNGHLTRSRVGRSAANARAHGRDRRGRRPLPGTRTADPVEDVRADQVPVTPAAAPPPLVVPVLVAADGVVATGAGSVRVARPEAASASSGPDGLVVHLFDHWCWAALDEVGPDLVVRAGTTRLSVPSGTTALLSIDDDGAQLVVVLEGEAEVAHAGGRIQLRSGAIAYLPVEGAPQVDVAPDDEIRADPLVARNLRLDEG